MNYYKGGSKQESHLPRRPTLTESKYGTLSTPASYDFPHLSSQAQLGGSHLIRTVPDLYLTEDLSTGDRDTIKSSPERDSRDVSRLITEKSLAAESSRLHSLTKALENLRNGSNAMIMAKETEYRLLVESQKKEQALLEEVILLETKSQESILRQAKTNLHVFRANPEFLTLTDAESAEVSPAKSNQTYD